jgi:hypothetical protein
MRHLAEEQAFPLLPNTVYDVESGGSIILMTSATKHRA